jgi:ribosomal protein S18 acetylase RimI-like enzyme
VIGLAREILPGRTGQPDTAIRYALLDPSHADAIAALQEAGIGDRMYPVTRAQIDGMLGPAGQTVGALAGAPAGERLIGFFAVQFSGDGVRAIAADFGLTGAEMEAAAYWMAVIVDPAFRGHGLQRRLMARMGERLFPAAAQEYGFVTVRTDNLASLRSLLSEGFAIFQVAARYDGHLRYSLYRIAPAACGQRGDSQRGDGQRGDGRWGDGRWVPLADTQAQSDLLAAGWIGWSFDAATAALLFARPDPDDAARAIMARR